MTYVWIAKLFQGKNQTLVSDSCVNQVCKHRITCIHDNTVHVEHEVEQTLGSNERTEGKGRAHPRIVHFKLAFKTGFRELDQCVTS